MVSRAMLSSESALLNSERLFCSQESAKVHWKIWSFNQDTINQRHSTHLDGNAVGLSLARTWSWERWIAVRACDHPLLSMYRRSLDAFRLVLGFPQIKPLLHGMRFHFSRCHAACSAHRHANDG